MSVQLSIFLYLYLAFLLLWLAFSLVAFYHIIKFGFKNFTTYFIGFLYLIIAIIILGISFFYIAQVDWQRDIFNINNNSSFSTWQ